MEYRQRLIHMGIHLNSEKELMNLKKQNGLNTNVGQILDCLLLSLDLLSSSSGR